MANLSQFILATGMPGALPPAGTVSCIVRELQYSKNRLLARAAQNGASIFARACRAATARERFSSVSCLVRELQYSKNRLLARAAQNGASIFASAYRAATARERFSSVSCLLTSVFLLVLL
jgi:hypothetical protein